MGIELFLYCYDTECQISAGLSNADDLLQLHVNFWESSTEKMDICLVHTLINCFVSLENIAEGAGKTLFSPKRSRYAINGQSNFVAEVALEH